MLAGLHIAGHHRRWPHGGQHGARRGDDLERLEAAGVERDVVVDQGAEDVERRGVDDGRGRIEVGGQDGAGSREIQHGLAAFGVYRDGDHDLPAAIHGDAGRAVVEAANGAAHTGLGVVLHKAHIAGHHCAAAGGDHGLDAGGAGLAGGDLSLEVGQVLVGAPRGPGAGDEGGAGVGLEKHTASHDRQGVQQHALFVDRA